MDARKLLAEIIRAARASSGLKQEVFAREVGVVAAHLSRLENGQGLPSIQLIHKIADHFDADRSQMMKLLRQIKGFEETTGERETPFDTAPCLDKPSRRGTDRKIPVLEDAALLRTWMKALAKGRSLPDIERTAPVSARMTRDRKAFWFEVSEEGMTGRGISRGDLLLVEPSHPAVNGKPTLVLFNDDVMLARWLEGEESIVLESVNSAQGRLPAMSRSLFDRDGGHALRIAGVHPCYRPFTPADE